MLKNSYWRFGGEGKEKEQTVKTKAGGDEDELFGGKGVCKG